MFQMEVMLNSGNQTSGVFGRLSFVEPLLVDLRNGKMLNDERSSADTSNDTGVRVLP